MKWSCVATRKITVLVFGLNWFWLCNLGTLSGDEQVIHVALAVDFGEDSGQAFGTLWEAMDKSGQTIAGAGFQTAFNTQDRSDRRMLQVFVRTKNRPEFRTEILPRPTSDAGTYLYGFDGHLFSYGRNAIDTVLRRWDEQFQTWQPDHQTLPLSLQVQGISLSADSQRVRYGDQTLLELPSRLQTSNPDDSEAADTGQSRSTALGTGETDSTPRSRGTNRLGEWYYADGTLLVRETSFNAADNVNDLIAYRWQPGQPLPLVYESGVRLPLSKWGEFIYCFGQLCQPESDTKVIAASNQGGIHYVKGNQWYTLREPDGKSFQIYSSINFHDRLLLGQYPTGELFQWTGQELHHLPGSPPVMSGVSRSAREAQTLAIYGGELYVGVWPWGEVWRQNALDGQWQFLGRLFTHPEPTDQWTHPYEPETKLLGPVLNRWGQRITSMVPMGDSLIISTSAKGPNPFEEKFTFLANGKHLEYGAVHRFRQPGCLAVPIEWTDQPTLLDFRFTKNRIEVSQDGIVVGSTEWENDLPAMLEFSHVKTGIGLYGPFRGRSVIQEEHPQTEQSSLRGAYLHPHRLIGQQTSSDECHQLIRRECKAMHEFRLNAVMPFVSTSSGQSLYASQLMTRYYDQSDPIASLATEARANGIQFHPVLPVIVCGGEQPAGILLERPDWALRHPDGSPMGYISPAHPKARAWLVDLVQEIVSLYQPDGILLDYLRYANRPHRLDALSEERFLATLPEVCSPAEEQRRLQAFKENELTELVRMITEVVRQHSAQIPISAYVWGHHVAENHLIAQVWPRWVELGYLDRVNISGYCYREKYGDQFLEEFKSRLSGAVAVNQRLSRQAELSFALGLKTSHGSVESADDIRSYQTIGSELGVNGYAYFTWEYLLPFLGSPP